MDPRVRVTVDCGGVSKTEQSHKKACDINNIVKRYIKTGLLKQRLSKGVYGDFSSIEDYQTCMNKIIDAQQDFMAVPSNIRKRFDNDPGKLIEFISDDDNYDEAIKLGLVPEPVEVQEPEPEPSPEPEPEP